MTHCFPRNWSDPHRSGQCSKQNPSPRLPGSAGIFFVRRMPGILVTLALSVLMGCQSLKTKSVEDWLDSVAASLPATGLLEFSLLSAWPDWLGQEGGPVTTSYEPDYIHWFDEFAFIEASGRRIESLKRKHGRDFPDIALSARRGTNVYRIRKEDADFFIKHGFSILSTGPYLWIDPGLQARKRSRDLKDWMQGYKDVELVERILRRWASHHAGVARLIRIGTSVQDRPIYALRIARNYSKQKPSLLFNGGHHGMEVLSVEYALDVACQLLDESCHPDQGSMDPGLRKYILNETTVWIVPVVNPDGLHRFWYSNGYLGRKNANGVDLNRNYPFYWKSGNEMASSGSPSSYKYRGQEAASEPETRMMMDLARRERFILSFSYHTYATRILFPYTPDGASNPYPDPAHYLARKMAARGTSYRTTRQYQAARKLYSVDGTDQDWLYHTFGTMAFIVEGSMSTPSYEDARLSIAGMRPISMEALSSIQQGPRLVFEVRDQEGRPVPEAHLRLLSRTYFERESWPVTEENGMAHVFLVPEEVLIGEIHASGFRPARFKLKCSNVCRQRFQLTPIRDEP